MKILKHLRLPSILLLYVAVILSAGASAQQRILKGDEYSELLNIVFSPEKYIGPTVQAAIILRYAPSTTPESELVFICEGSQSRVIEIRPQHGSIFNEANQLLKMDPNAASDIPKLADRVAVVASKRGLQEPKCEQMYGDMLRSVSGSLTVLREEYKIRQKTNEVTIPMDGTTYTLILLQGLQRLEMNFYDTELGKSKQRIPLTTWMASVRGEIDNNRF
ncbi:MAG TPA: hypothetical protein VL240_10725 [Candidatus Binatia bacterium]|nr:hypothetical protein [Candidatus Binatia bacterium]